MSNCPMCKEEIVPAHMTDIDTLTVTSKGNHILDDKYIFSVPRGWVWVVCPHCKCVLKKYRQ